MQGIIWLWKHRHCWKQLKYLYENRYSLKLALHTSKAEDAERILACLREFDRVPLVRRVTPRVGKVQPLGQIPRRKDRPMPKRLHATYFLPEANEKTWLKEKPDLLNTHTGWFVAYQDGVRVALESDCDGLEKALDAALGKYRRPITFHEIVESPEIHRTLSPQYKWTQEDL